MGLAKDAWKVLKFTKVYAARKKFEIKGAIAFKDPKKQKIKNSEKLKPWNFGIVA